MMMAMITRTLLQNVALCAINENDVDDDDDQDDDNTVAECHPLSNKYDVGIS